MYQPPQNAPLPRAAAFVLVDALERKLLNGRVIRSIKLGRPARPPVRCRRMSLESTQMEQLKARIDHAQKRAAAVKQLFNDHNRALLCFLRARLGSDAEARDVAQEAYVRLLELDNLIAVGFLRAYLFRVAANIAIDRLRHNAVRESLCSSELIEALADERSPERIAMAAEDLSVLKRVVSDLPEKCRNAFVWHVFGGQSTSQIARHLGLTDRMIRLYVAHALALCKKGLEDPRDRGAPS